MGVPVDLAERFERHVAEPTAHGCLMWTAGHLPRGYGRVWVDGRMAYAHRVAYAMYYGEVPDGMDLDHLCRNPACVNPLHLEPVTRRVNLLRGRTLVAAHASDRDCGFADCKNCRRFKAAS